MKRVLLLTAIATLILLLLLLSGCGSDRREGGVTGESATGADIVQYGDPVLAAASGYVGSERCGQCHGIIFTGWSKSLHNKPLKTVAEVGGSIFVNDGGNDKTANSVNDFVEGLDLASNSNFSVYGTNAPRLSYSEGKYYITIGAVSYEVQRVQGGNGYWKQRYHTKIGYSYYILPVQYNEANREYTAYNASNWYKTDNTPRYTQAYGSAELVLEFNSLNNSTDKKGMSLSWENRCAGCHQTGLNIATQGSVYSSTTVTEVVSGYVELNIGCEECHGPGENHVNSGGNPEYIINPESFRSLGYTGLRVANMVCGRCHSRGEGNAKLTGMNLALEYPARFDFGVLKFPIPGNNVVDNSTKNPFVKLNTTTDYYGYTTLTSGYPASTNTTFPFFTNYRDWYSFNGYTFPKYIASGNHHQQWTDMEQGPHAPDKDYDTTCWGCHDPHKAAGDHQINDSIKNEGGVTVATKNDDDTLCLACHAGFGPFASLSASDVVAGNSVMETAVLDHMGEEAVMRSYDPTGAAGVGRCSKCHMPKTAKSAIYTAVTSGITPTIQEGDIHNHSFNIIWPSVNTLTSTNTTTNSKLATMRGMVNSCYATGCHTNNPADPEPTYTHEITEWAESGHADFTGEPFRHWDADGSVSTSCAKCHSKYGFLDFIADGDIDAAAALGSVVSCGTCHAKEGGGRTRWDNRATSDALDVVTFPSGSTANMGDASNMCMVCHQGRESRNSVESKVASNPTTTTYTFTNIHYFAAAATFFGSDVHGGYEYTGNTYRGKNTFSSHQTDKQTCIGCHLRGTAKDHKFVPQVADCTTASCHTGASFDALSGSPGTNFGDIVSLQAALLTEMRTYADATVGKHIAYSATSYPYFFVDTNNNGTVDSGETTSFTYFDGKLLKAAYNYQVSKKDTCSYIHNGTYIKQLLYDSIKDLNPAATPPVARP